MKTIYGIAAMLALCATAPAVAAPAPDGAREGQAPTDPRRALDADLPTDRPIVATVIEIDPAAGTVMLSTPHGNVALAVSPELAERLTIGDVVVVRFSEDDSGDFPSASPPGEAPPAQEPQRI